jgi:hypothetical protein
MIKVTEQHNIKCIKCLAVPEKIVRIGIYYMCYDCFNVEFEGCSKGSFDVKGELGKAYHKWLEIYFQMAEDEFL